MLPGVLQKPKVAAEVLLAFFILFDGGENLNKKYI